MCLSKRNVCMLMRGTTQKINGFYLASCVCLRNICTKIRGTPKKGKASCVCLRSIRISMRGTTQQIKVFSLLYVSVLSLVYMYNLLPGANLHTGSNSDGEQFCTSLCNVHMSMKCVHMLLDMHFKHTTNVSVLIRGQIRCACA